MCAAALLLAGASASADPMDLSLNRLSYYNNTPWSNGGVRYEPSRWAFRGGCGTAGIGPAIASFPTRVRSRASGGLS